MTCSLSRYPTEGEDRWSAQFVHRYHERLCLSSNDYCVESIIGFRVEYIHVEYSIRGVRMMSRNSFTGEHSSKFCHLKIRERSIFALVFWPSPQRFSTNPILDFYIRITIWWNVPQKVPSYVSPSGCLPCKRSVRYLITTSLDP